MDPPGYQEGITLDLTSHLTSEIDIKDEPLEPDPLDSNPKLTLEIVIKKEVIESVSPETKDLQRRKGRPSPTKRARNRTNTNLTLDNNGATGGPRVPRMSLRKQIQTNSVSKGAVLPKLAAEKQMPCSSEPSDSDEIPAKAPDLSPDLSPPDLPSLNAGTACVVTSSCQNSSSDIHSDHVEDFTPAIPNSAKKTQKRMKPKAKSKSKVVVSSRQRCKEPKKTHQCEQCPKKFRTSELLRKHKNNVHPSDNCRTLCKDCPIEEPKYGLYFKSFKTSQGLRGVSSQIAINFSKVFGRQLLLAWSNSKKGCFCPRFAYIQNFI